MKTLGGLLLGLIDASGEASGGFPSFRSGQGKFPRGELKSFPWEGWWYGEDRDISPSQGVK
ncbi:hypothetical protein [Paenarthrobacter sp. NPDC057981]|uniref:hypothetical protein n=1 Tax=Paenarthrobacter sp. NPDC057981 TaxID=3346297 RepID=UPI0036D9FDFA